MLWFLGEIVVFAVFVVFGRDCGFCRLCGFLARLWFLGELVVFGTRVAHCVSETGKATRSGINQRGMRIPCAKRTACNKARIAPTTRQKTAKALCCGFLPSLWFFGRACGFLARLWFLGAFHFPSPTDPYSRAHLTSIDEDALEGVYFAFSLILRCLPYFCRKTRPRASYDLIRAHSGVLVAVGLWFLGELVVFGLACGFLPSLWFLGELVVVRRVPFPISHRPILQSPSHQHRRGCPRGGLFRVFAHSKVFALLLPKNAS